MKIRVKGKTPTERVRYMLAQIAKLDTRLASHGECHCERCMDVLERKHQLMDIMICLGISELDVCELVYGEDWQQA